MTKEEALCQRLVDDGVHIEPNEPLPKKIDGMYIAQGQRGYVFLRAGMRARRRLCALAHEAGHHYTGVTGNDAKDEHGARKWVANWVGLIRILDAWAKGAQSEWEIAEALDITVLTLLQSYEVYKQQFGEGWHQVGGWWVRFYPSFEAEKTEEGDDG